MIAQVFGDSGVHRRTLDLSVLSDVPGFVGGVEQGLVQKDGGVEFGLLFDASGMDQEGVVVVRQEGVLEISATGAVH